MTTRLLSCFTWLLLAGSPWPAVGCQPAPVGTSPPKVERQGHGGRPADPAPSTAADGLPCADSSADCLRRLGDLAVENSTEARVISQAIAYQRRKLWTSWLNADGLNPLAVGLRVARNLAGGGDRAAARLEIAQLERRRAEVEAALRQAVAQEVATAEAAGRHLRGARERLDAYRARVRLLSVGYRLGEGSTEVMLGEWLAGGELRDRAGEAEAERGRALARLRVLVTPPAHPVTGATR